MTMQRSLTRRGFLASVCASSLLLSQDSSARTFFGDGLPWDPGAVDAPPEATEGGWQVFTMEEARMVEAIVERLIPADDLSASGKDAGCAVFIDRQLAGEYGTSDRLYMQGPFQAALPTQGDQSSETPLTKYRQGLASLDAHCRSAFTGRAFAELSPEERDDLLGQMDRDEVQWEGPVAAHTFFRLVLDNTMEGFFADPVYGGNRDMVSWKMIGFPGTRYDYRDHVLKHNQPYTLPPVSLMGREDWAVRS